ncbi:hypothetical protein D1614_00035 [Maribellus luteus]|uniref:Uncharacterized protein n=1 Tax=Maribellus luteus TaxID=2305463 RepID=A0A399T664_9BACT|nr:hypothetical protein D1614_00035 [Maribellus luteus]
MGLIFSHLEFSINITATLLLENQLRSSKIFIEKQIIRTVKLQRCVIDLIVKIATFSWTAMKYEF